MHMAAFSYQQALPFSLDFASFPSVPPFELPPLSTQQAEDLAGVSSCLPFYYDPLVADSIIPVEIPPLVAAISPVTSNTTTTPTLERSSSRERGRTLLSGDNKITSSSSSPRRGQVASKARCSPEKKRKERQRNNPLSAKDAIGVKSRKLKSCREATKDAGEKKAPQEAPTGYIHVRARRGQATDSHSLAERVRRERIRERMKVLQGLVPGCEKVVGKALLLDEIINYVQSLQIQVEFLSMKLASMNPMLHDFGSDFDGYMSLSEKLESMSPALTNVQRTSHTQPTAFADTANNTVQDPSVPLLLHGEGPIFSFPQDDGSNFVMQVEVGNDGQCFLSQAELKTISSFQ